MIQLEELVYGKKMLQGMFFNYREYCLFINKAASGRIDSSLMQLILAKILLIKFDNNTRIYLQLADLIKSGQILLTNSSVNQRISHADYESGFSILYALKNDLEGGQVAFDESKSIKAYLNKIGKDSEDSKMKQDVNNTINDIFKRIVLKHEEENRFGIVSVQMDDLERFLRYFEISFYNSIRYENDKLDKESDQKVVIKDHLEKRRRCLNYTDPFVIDDDHIYSQDTSFDNTSFDNSSFAVENNNRASNVQVEKELHPTKVHLMAMIEKVPFISKNSNNFPSEEDSSFRIEEEYQPNDDGDSNKRQKSLEMFVSEQYKECFKENREKIENNLLLRRVAIQDKKNDSDQIVSNKNNSSDKDHDEPSPSLPSDDMLKLSLSSEPFPSLPSDDMLKLPLSSEPFPSLPSDDMLKLPLNPEPFPSLPSDDMLKLSPSRESILGTKNSMVGHLVISIVLSSIVIVINILLISVDQLKATLPLISLLSASSIFLVLAIEESVLGCFNRSKRLQSVPSKIEDVKLIDESSKFQLLS